MTPIEKKASNGYSKNIAANHKPSSAKKELPNDFVIKSVSALPESVDWRSKGNIVSPVFMRHLLGICFNCCHW